ncbi:MAG: phosphoglucomutase/phosphomannomutase family protein, partial [Ruminococcaceae bacterium]|nr:phosphoglucomutase/phosphomannomutase family protein [Oscillospiraceae bacterium]
MIKFGTGGWRAVIADGFTKENIRLLSQGFCNMIKDGGKEKLPVVIGYDRRFLSKEAAGWIGEVVAGNGIVAEIIDGESPTPLIMFTVKEHGLEYGMAVTASHNPAIYNGIKVFMQGGRDADEIMTQAFEGYIEQLEGQTVPAVPFAEGLANGKIRLIDPMNEYV